MEKWGIEIQSWTAGTLCVCRHLHRVFTPPLAFMLNEMDFPSDTPVYPGVSEGNQQGSSLGERDIEVFEVHEMLFTSVLAVSKKSLPLYRS